MPYPQDLLGKYVDYRIDPGGSRTAGMALVNGVLPGQTTNAMVNVYNGDAVNTPGLNPVWNFAFLKYIAGAVTTASLAGAVLTGPMSGCYLCKYTQNGQPGLAHVGTANSPDSADSVAAKTAWLAFVGLPGVSAVTGGSPFDYFTTSEYQAAMLSPGLIPSVCGYFAGGSAYAMLFAPLPVTMNGLGGRRLLKVAGVKAMTLQPWSTIAAMRTFR